MATKNQGQSINYIHNQPESFISRLLRTVLTLARRKKNTENSLASGQYERDPAPIPKSLTANFQVDVSELNDRRIWTLKPKQNVSEQVIFYLHGGSYIYNIQSAHWNMVEQLLLKTNATIVLPDYPLAPQSLYDEVLAFADTIYHKLLETTSSKNIIFMGESAGAGLALGLAHSLNHREKPLPQQLILISPWLDITMNNPDIVAADKDDKVMSIKGQQMAGEAYAGELDPKDYKASPIYGDFSGLPTISLFIGTYDLFVADCRKLKDKMRSANLPFNYFEYPKMIHGWILVPQLKESQHAFDQILQLINLKHIKESNKSNQKLKEMRRVELDFLETAPFKIATAQRIKATKEEVFQFLKGAENWPTWHTSITKVVWTSKEPYQKGTTRTVMINDRFTAHEEFLLWEENKRFVFRFLQSDIPMATALVEDFEVRDLEDGYCELKMTVAGETSGLLRLFNGVLRRINQRGIKKSLQNLAYYFENRPVIGI